MCELQTLWQLLKHISNLFVMVNLLAIISDFLTIGVPAIDNSLDELLKAMRDFPKDQFFGTTLSMAKTLGLILALCVGSYESWMMMLGRRGMDVMKLLRIVGLSMCITWSGFVCESLSSVGKFLEDGVKKTVKDKNNEVAAKEKFIAKLQKKYVERLSAVQDSLEKAKQVQEIGEDAGVFDKIVYTVKNLGDIIENNLKYMAVVTETKVSEWINDVIRFLGELVFQMSYYGMFVAQRAFMTIMAIFCPIAFALSIVPPWSNAWSQWMSKYLSLSLWGVVIYICIYYVDYILLYCLGKDEKAYTALLGTVDNSWSQIGTLGMQGIGSNCLYAMGMLVGAYMIKFVPEVCSWLIPGGVSSSIGSAMGGAATQGVSIAAGAAGSTAGSVVGGAGGAVIGGAVLSSSLAGAYNQARSEGSGKAGSLGTAIISHTPLGKGYTAGSNNAENYNSARNKNSKGNK